jgi:hypothetical protein
MTSYAQDLAARYAAGRARLWGNAANNNAPLLIPQFLPARAVVALPPPPAAPSADELSHPYGAPLNMLAPCSWRFLVAYASLKTGVSAKDILSPNRSRDIMPARYAAIGLVYQHTQFSLPQTGKAFDRDHSTVLHALHKTGTREKLVETSPLSTSSHKNYRPVGVAS